MYVLAHIKALLQASLDGLERFFSTADSASAVAESAVESGSTRSEGMSWARGGWSAGGDEGGIGSAGAIIHIDIERTDFNPDRSVGLRIIVP